MPAIRKSVLIVAIVAAPLLVVAAAIVLSQASYAGAPEAEPATDETPARSYGEAIPGLTVSGSDATPPPVESPGKSDSPVTTAEADERPADSDEEMSASPDVDTSATKDRTNEVLGLESSADLSDEEVRRRFGLDAERARLRRQKRAQYKWRGDEEVRAEDRKLYEERFGARRGLKTPWHRLDREHETARRGEVWPQGVPRGPRYRLRDDRLDDDPLGRYDRPVPGIQRHFFGPRSWRHSLPGLDLDDETLTIPDLPDIEGFEYDGPWPWELEGETHQNPRELEQDEAQPDQIKDAGDPVPAQSDTDMRAATGGIPYVSTSIDRGSAVAVCA